jgi:hypothetical protein
MIDHKAVRCAVVNGLQEYIGCNVIMANQAVTVPKHPYISFTVTTPIVSNNGTYGRYTDGMNRKLVKQIWSFTSQTSDADEAVMLIHKAHDYFDSIGREFLKSNGIVVESLGNITNRDTLLTVMYEYRCGFDVTFTLLDEIDRAELNEGEIATADVIYTE